MMVTRHMQPAHVDVDVLSTHSPDSMPNLQNETDARGIQIDQVGYKNIAIRLLVPTRQHGLQETTGTAALSVALPPEQRGTHMSRFVEVLTRHRGPLHIDSLLAMLGDQLHVLDARAGRIAVDFGLFLRRPPPVTVLADELVPEACYRCTLQVEVAGGSTVVTQRVVVPVSTVCPCSKAISRYGAHNQRTMITLEVRSVRAGIDPAARLSFEELIELAEGTGSTPVYPLLKRADERFVTERGYENPRFVEDVIRDVCLMLKRDPRVERFSVQTESLESIHQHDAFAEVAWIHQEHAGKGVSDRSYAR